MNTLFPLNLIPHMQKLLNLDQLLRPAFFGCGLVIEQRQRYLVHVMRSCLFGLNEL